MPYHLAMAPLPYYITNLYKNNSEGKKICSGSISKRSWSSVPSKLHTESIPISAFSRKFCLLHSRFAFARAHQVPQNDHRTNLALPALAKCSWSSLRSISDSQLRTLLYFHLCPIYLVLFKGSYLLMEGISHLEAGFTLRCLQRLSVPDLATL